MIRFGTACSCLLERCCRRVGRRTGLAFPWKRTAVADVFHYASVLRVRDASPAQSVNPPSAVVALECMLARCYYLEADSAATIARRQLHVD